MCSKFTQTLLFDSEKGMAVVMVLVFTGVLMALGTALITNAVNEKLIAEYNNRDIKLYYITEAGIEVGLALINEAWENNAGAEPFFVFDYDSEIQGVLGDGSYTVTFNELKYCPEENYYVVEVISGAFLKEGSKTMTVIVTLDPENITITEWQRAVPLPY